MSHGDRLTHLDAEGRAHMVDVSDKPPVARRAVAVAHVSAAPSTLEAARDGRTPKGDVAAAARIAGIMAAKRTAELIPLCHPLPLEHVAVQVEVRPEEGVIAIEASAATTARTGVEMEALTAVSVAALTVVDMVKAVDKGAVITDIRVESKTGGKSGDWTRA
jgi:cyclic pyranopterin phosphate synthase